jgi:hypothetical protein
MPAVMSPPAVGPSISPKGGPHAFQTGGHQEQQEADERGPGPAVAAVQQPYGGVDPGIGTGIRGIRWEWSHIARVDPLGSGGLCSTVSYPCVMNWPDGGKLACLRSIHWQ